jgi:hypothetical protein
MVGRIRAGSDPSVEGWGTVSEGAGDELGVGTAGVPAPSEILEVVHGHWSSAIRDDVRQPMLIAERLRRERLAFDARTGRGGNVAIFFIIIIGMRIVWPWWW